MNLLVNAEKMKEIDTITIEKKGIPAMELMENAAMTVASVIMENSRKDDRILAVCGVGNNGGDGVATARILSGNGYHADILILGDQSKFSVQMKEQVSRAKKIGLNIFNNVKFSEYNVIIDAIFGIGLKKPITGIYESVIREINEENNTVYSVDLPSGISTDTGKVLNISVNADYTVTFGLMKQGLILYPGCEYAGKVIVADIGFSEEAFQAVNLDTFVYDKQDFSLLPLRPAYSNKGSFGKVLIIAGSLNMSGACYLAAKAAYRSGAGLVKVLTVEDNRNMIQTSLPEAILSTYDPQKLKNNMEADHIIGDVSWATAIVVGPGIGISAASEHLLDIVLQNAKVPVIIDADAVNILSEKSDYVKGMRENEPREVVLPDNIIITPHIKEMAGLCHCEVKDIRMDIIGFAKKTTQNKKFVLALKDARTIVTDGYRTYVNVTGNNGMATGGSGDVLTGIIAAFLAQGMKRFEATALGVFAHGLAGDYAAAEKSKYSLIAGDIIEALPKVFLENKGE